MTVEAAPPAVAPSAAPAVPATPPPAAAAPPKVTSLLPEALAVTAPPAAAPPAAPVDPNAPGTWILAEGVLGQGERPEWFKSDKYKNVAEQAKAYPELEKRFGAFVGAPADGKYAFTAPEGLNVEFDDKHPLVPTFTDWAKKNQLNQSGYSELLGLLARYEEAQVPNMNELKATLGANADVRIENIAKWGTANLSPEQYGLLRQATGGAQCAAVLQVIEAIIGKTKQVSLPGPGPDVPGGAAAGEAAIRAEQSKLGQDGKRLWDTDPKHRRKVEQMWTDYYTAQARQ